MTEPHEPRVYVDPTTLSLDGACDLESQHLDREYPWSWPHRWRPRKEDA